MSAEWGSGTALTNSQRRAPAPRGHVVVLDDEPEIAALIASMVRRAGFSAAETTTAEDFFAALDQAAPTHVVVDLVMPGMDGLEVLQHLRDKPGLKIIVASGSGGRVLESVRHSAESKGIRILGMLSKPFRFRDLKGVFDSLSEDEAIGAAAPDSENQKPAEPLAREAITRALEGGEFIMFLQPKIDCASRAGCGFEALARWDDPNSGLKPASAFISQIESAGLETSLARVMLRHACAFLAAWPDHDFHIAVNLSVQTCHDPDFPVFLTDLVRQTGVAAQRLTLEVTETGALEITPDDIAALTRLHLKGFRLAIDDFGIGRSSLQRLVQIPFDELKVDRLFVSEAASSERGRQIVQSVVAIARTMGMSVTAEGIETQAQLDCMTGLGVDSVQGNLFSAPLPLDAARLWIPAAGVKVGRDRRVTWSG